MTTLDPQELHNRCVKLEAELREEVTAHRNILAENAVLRSIIEEKDDEIGQLQAEVIRLGEELRHTTARLHRLRLMGNDDD